MSVKVKNTVRKIQVGYDESMKLPIQTTVESGGLDGETRIITAQSGSVVSSTVVYPNEKGDVWREAYVDGVASASLEDALAAAVSNAQGRVALIVQEKIIAGADKSDFLLQEDVDDVAAARTGYLQVRDKSGLKTASDDSPAQEPKEESAE